MSAAARWMVPESRSRRIVIGLAIYVACLIVYALVARDRLATHTPYNHYALLADAWLHGRQDLLGGPPAYAGGNDFALFEGKWFVSFPPFPAVLMMPLVWAAGSPENFRDGQFVVWLAGIGPAVTFLVLEKLRRTGRSARTEVENVQLALLFAFGTVYFFCAVQGTVWFTAHVVATALGALFLLFALDCERPVLAGLMLACLFLTRPPMLLFSVFFALEAIRVAYKEPADGPGLLRRVLSSAPEGIDWRRAAHLVALAAAPAALGLVVAAVWNHARFHTWNPSAMGHEHLTVVWQARIKRWGLFSYHFLPRNLGVAFASLPWLPPKGVSQWPGGAPFMISGHGLALWFTTPIYLWLARPKSVTFAWAAAAIAAVGPAVLNLLYQNSGWFTFGYRFSNDYAVLLFLMLAIGVRKMNRTFWLAAVWSVAWATFGAISFDRPAWSAFYSHDPSAVFPPD
jgi:hypothetical protein